MTGSADDLPGLGAGPRAEGLLARPPVDDDLSAVIALANRCDRPIVGRDAHRPDVLRTMWTHPDFDLSRDARVIVAAGGEIIAYAQTRSITPHVHPRLWGRVAPEHEGRGLGTALVTWAEARTRQRLDAAPDGTRVTLHAFCYAEHEPTRRLLCGQGLVPVRGAWHMAVDLDGDLQAPQWPEGIVLRPFRETEHRAVFAALREAFRDHWGFVESDFEAAFARNQHWVHNDDDYDPALWFVAWDGDEVAGVAQCRLRAHDDPDTGWVDELGVPRPWRRRGLARALLRHAFLELRRRGQRRAGLGVDAESLTGATRLYEGVGMKAYRHFEEYEKELRGGQELSTTSVEG